MGSLTFSGSSGRSRHLQEFGTVNFPARAYSRQSKNSTADASFWKTRAVESQEHRAYLVTRFAPDEFVAKDYLNRVWSKPTIVNGLEPRTKKSRNKIFRVEWAFRDSGDAAVTAVKDALLSNLPNVQPDVLVAQTRQQNRSERTCGRRIWAAEADFPMLDEQGCIIDKMQLVRMEVLDCPIWMRHSDDEIPFMKGFATSKGELADLFAITVTILLRDEETRSSNPRMGELPNACEQRNRFRSYVHVCIDREIAIAAWLDAIYKHGDRHFRPEGDMQLPGGQTIGLWPPEGRLDLYWEGKTIDYEAIFICVTSMCFESMHTDASDALIDSAIDKFQQRRDGFIGLDPSDDYAYRMLKKKKAPVDPMRWLRYAKKTELEVLPRRRSRQDTFQKIVERKDNAELRGLSPDSSLSSADESPERPDWMDIIDSSSTTDEVPLMEAREKGDDVKEEDNMEKDTAPTSPLEEPSPKEPDEVVSDDEDSPEPTVRTRTRRGLRSRRAVQRRTRSMQSWVEPQKLAGAQRRRQIAEMNPEMERFARGI